MKKLQTKSFGFKVKEVTESEGKTYVSGYASTFGDVDSYNEVVVRGAFASTLSDASKAKRVLVCLHHDTRKIIGMPEVMKEDTTGLFVKFEILETSYGKDARILVDAGVLDEMSIGYYLKEFEDRDGIRYIKDLELIEFSLVSRAANPNAVVTRVEKKAFEDGVVNIDLLTDEELTELKSGIEHEYNKRIYERLIN